MPVYTDIATVPELMAIYRGAVKDVIPVVGASHKATGDPTSAFRVQDVTIDPHHLAAYCQTTGLRFGNEVPVTYPYVLSFPLVMKVLTAKDFPFKAMGAVHISNTITQHRPVEITDSFELRVHAENLRAHRRGLIIDLVTELAVDGEVVWEQTSTFLGNGAKLSSEAPEVVRERGEDTGQSLERPEVPARASNSLVRVSTDDIKHYAEASGDKNPIHVSKVGAKAFGFPATIAHGMYTAAVMLGTLEGRLPKAFTYTVDFAKPVILPARVSLWVDSGDGEWTIQARKASKPETLHAVGQIKSNES